MDMLEVAEQQELIYITSVWTLDVVWKTCQVTETDGKKDSGKSVFSEQLDYDDLKPFNLDQITPWRILLGIKVES